VEVRREETGLVGTIDLSQLDAVRFKVGEHTVAASAEHFARCLNWLVHNVDTDTVISKEGISEDDWGNREW